MKNRLLSAVALATALVAGPASAAIVIDPDNSWQGQSSVTRSGITFTAWNTGVTPAVSDTFVYTERFGINGVGIEGGRTPTEVDTDERINAAFTTRSALAPVASLNVGLFYDGDEFLDEGERITVAGQLASGGTVNYTLQVTASNSLQFVMGSGALPTGFSFTNLALAAPGQGGHWSLVNPFGNGDIVTAFSLTASTAFGCLDGACPNDSDFILTQVALVPEPSEYAMMAAGLMAVGFIVRRRRQRQA